MKNIWLYGFGNYHYTGFGGMSGGPVLNGKGEAIGMQAQSDANVTFAIKLEYLNKLLSSKIGIACSRPFKPGLCLKEGKEKVKREAGRGNAVAQYHLGRKDSYVNETARDWSESLYWLGGVRTKRVPAFHEKFGESQGPWTEGNGKRSAISGFVV